MVYQIDRSASPYSRDGEITISMADPKPGRAVFKEDAKRDTANALLDEVGARALGATPKIGAINRLTNAALPDRVDADAIIAKLRLETGVVYQIADGVSPYSRDGETAISMADLAAGRAVFKDAKRAAVEKPIGGVGARMLSSNLRVRRRVRETPPS